MEKRAWFITDTHMGIKNNSEEWIEIIRSYFFEWFFPLIRKEYKDGDILIHLGDWHDSRQSLNLKVIDLSIEIAEEMSKIFKDGIYVIAGNHDVWGKNSNEINSLKILQRIPNFNIFTEPVTLYLGGKKFCMMPWIENREIEKETLFKFDTADYLCCHSDIAGLNFNKYTKVDIGINESEITGFKRIYSGHIHYSQIKGDKIRILGSPYEMTRSDMDNPKFILRLDLESNREDFFYNQFSPKHISIQLNEILNKSPNELKNILENNFVDIIVDTELRINPRIDIISEKIPNIRRMEIKFIDERSNLNEIELKDIDYNYSSPIDIIKDVTEAWGCNEEIKKRIIKKFEEKYLKISPVNEN